MARRNLCMVFGPTLISKPIGEDDGSLVNDMQPTFNVIETFMNLVSIQVYGRFNHKIPLCL